MAGNVGFQLGLLPEPKVNKKAVATAYGVVALLLLIVINLELLMPEKLQLSQYHVTEIIPMPSLRPEPLPVQPKPQADFANRLYYGPSNPKAFALISDDVARQLPTFSENQKVAVTQDAQWEGEHTAEMQERFVQWLAS